MVNNALNVNDNTQNGKHVDIAITTHGSDWYWVATALHQASNAAYITAAITLVAAIAYFSMASNLGWTPITVEFPRSNPVVSGSNREIFYVRYIDWFITTPLLLLDLLLTAGMPWPTILYVLLLDWVMVVCGLVGALVKTSYKWGYYAFGCVAFFGIAWHLAYTARNHAKALGPDVHRAFATCGVWTLFLWFLYPISWGLCEGGNVIAPDSEAAFYGALDVCAKPVFGALLLWGHRGIDPARLGLSIRDYDDDPNWRFTNEKKLESAQNGSNGATNGHGHDHDA